MAQLNFDANQVAPDTGVLDAIPAGWYNCIMDQSEMKPTKDGAGAYLECRFDVMDGAFKGRKLYARLNLRNASPQAQEIAYKQLSAIAHAVQVLQVQDSSQLHGRPLKIKVSVKAADGQYEAANEIKAYKDINFVTGAPPAAQAPAFAPPVAPVQNFTAPAQPAGGWVAQAPQQPAPPVQQAPAPVAAPAWQQPAAAQPWQQAPAPVQAPQQPAPVQAPAPVQQQPAAPAWAPPAGVAPAAGPQTAVPAWAQAPQQ